MEGRVRAVVLVGACVALARYTPVMSAIPQALLGAPVAEAIGLAGGDDVDGLGGAATSMRGLVRNVTTDMDELVSLVEEFFREQDDRVLLEARFRDFLSERASKGFAGVERTLDSILWIYKLLLPFIVISLCGSAFGSGTATTDVGEGVPAGSSSAKTPGSSRHWKKVRAASKAAQFSSAIAAKASKGKRLKLKECESPDSVLER